jgi:hypothetical protein
MDMPSATANTWDYADHVQALHADDGQLAEEVANFQGIASVLAWMEQRGLTQAVVDMTGQDEFHYDFLIQLEPGGRWLAFGVT